VLIWDEIGIHMKRIKHGAIKIQSLGSKIAPKGLPVWENPAESAMAG